MCQSCDMLVINGVACHEHGCPDAWKNRSIECEWCGTEFVPDEMGQTCCTDECYRSYYDLAF